MSKAQQLDLFKKQSLNCTYELKRQMRLVQSESGLSRDTAVDMINNLSARENLPGQKISKVTYESWFKDSEPSRVPSPVKLVLFCAVMKNNSPLTALACPLGCRLIDVEDQKILAWGKAELAKRRATKKAQLARLALEEVE